MSLFISMRVIDRWLVNWFVGPLVRQSVRVLSKCVKSSGLIIRLIILEDLPAIMLAIQKLVTDGLSDRTFGDRPTDGRMLKIHSWNAQMESRRICVKLKVRILNERIRIFWLPATCTCCNSEVKIFRNHRPEKVSHVVPRESKQAFKKHWASRIQIGITIFQLFDIFPSNSVRFPFS